MKKILNILALGVSAVAISACTKNDSKGFVSLNIWTYYNATTESSFQSMINEYNLTRGKEQKIAISSISQGSVNDLTNALIDSATNQSGAEEMPDMFISYADCAYELDGYGKIASLDKYFTEEELSNFNDGFIKEGRIGSDNSLKILPVSKSTEALYINETDFNKFLENNPDCGIDYSDFSTIEGLINASKIYYEKTGKAFFGRDSLDNYFVIGAKQLGIDIFEYNGDNFEINFDGAVFKKLWDSYYVPFVKGYFASVGLFRSSDIQSGEILSYIGSTSSGGYFPAYVEKNGQSHSIEPRVLPTPIFENGAKYAVSQGAGFCVTKSTAEKEKAAVDFLKWLCKKENITNFANNSGYFPATKDGFSDEFINSQTKPNYKKNFETCRETLNNYNMYTNKVGPNSTSYRNFLKSRLDTVCKNARKAVLESADMEEAIIYYTADERFNEWFDSLKTECMLNY